MSIKINLVLDPNGPSQAQHVCVHIYIYIYVCVCVCVCVSMYVTCVDMEKMMRWNRKFVCRQLAGRIVFKSHSRLCPPHRNSQSKGQGPRVRKERGGGKEELVSRTTSLTQPNHPLCKLPTYYTRTQLDLPLLCLHYTRHGRRGHSEQQGDLARGGHQCEERKRNDSGNHGNGHEYCDE